MFDNEFFPTPKSLLERIDSDFFAFFKELPPSFTMLEPSAGKGDIADYLKEKYNKKYNHYGTKVEIDCIEINEECRAALKGKEYFVIHDNFLTFNTYKHYDLIYMNPPFSEGDKHLLKAIKLQKQYGGKILCILNVETLRNPYTNVRKELLNRLEGYGAKIKYYQNSFNAFDSERRTDVEIAVVALSIPIPERLFSSFIFDKLDEDKRTYKLDPEEEQKGEELVPESFGFIDGFVAQYNDELRAGIEMMKEYQAYSKINHLRFNDVLSEEDTKYEKPLLSIKLQDKDLDENSLNTFITSLRYKYWKAIFFHPNFRKLLTEKMYSEISSNINDMTRYDITLHNILEMYAEIRRNTIKGVEDSICELFNRFSAEYSWINNSSKNIHYYNGWKTNKAHKINKKVIIPMYNVWECYRYNGREHWSLRDYKAISAFNDIVKTFDYFAGESYRHIDSMADIKNAIEINFKREETKDIETKYFFLSFYKKGTCHITFKDDVLLERFNLYVGKLRQWLPPDYGEKPYGDLGDEERVVADSFSGGEKEYNAIYQQRHLYLIRKNEILMLPNGMESKKDVEG